MVAGGWSIGTSDTSVDMFVGRMDVADANSTPTVPEPTTMLLLGLGLVGLAGIRRKFKQ